jgi:hypothetical protein
MAAPRLPGFVVLSTYLRATRDLFSDEDQRQLEATLVTNPESGAVVPGAGGVRKLRVALEGRGKSGGARVIYYYRASVGRIYLLTAYAKNVRENLTQAERNAMRVLTARLEREP